METDTNTDAFDLVKMGDSSLKSIEEMFLYVREALMGSDFSGAYEMYRKIESIDADNEEVQLGLLRSKYHIYEIDQLFEYFLHAFENEGYKILEACPEDRFHINQAVNKYAVPGYFDEKQIEELCVFDRRYKSGLDQRIDEQERFYEKIGSDSSYQWLKQNGSDLIKGKIEAVEKIYEKRITQARKEDEKRIREIENEYRRFLFSAYTRIREKSEKASECKEIDYRKLIKKIDQSDDEYSLRELVQEMESFGEYGEIKHYLKICRKKLLIVEERQEEQIRLSKQLDQGERALSEGRYEEAERVFSDILSKYADHPYACLGLFMARNGLRNETKLFDFLAYMFSQYETETVWVCEDDEEHIDKVCMRYVLPDFLEKKEIWAIYQKGCSFESETKNRIQQKEEIEKYLNKEPLIIRARENGDDHIMELFGNVLSMYDERIQSALKADEVKRNAVWDTYRYCLKEKDNEADQLYRERLIKKQEHDEQCYQDNLKCFYIDLGIEELKELVDRFDKDYRDCG